MLPPLTGVAVKVTELPAQAGFVPLVIEIVAEGVTLVVLLTVIELEVAVADVTQVALEVMTQVTACPLVMVELVKVALFVPVSVPLTFHW